MDPVQLGSLASGACFVVAETQRLYDQTGLEEDCPVGYMVVFFGSNFTRSFRDLKKQKKVAVVNLTTGELFKKNVDCEVFPIQKPPLR